MAETEKYFYGLGRRKEATARVRLYTKKGSSMINEKTVEDYFNLSKTLSEVVFEPLKLTGNMDKMIVTARVSGGGLSSQAEAIRLGVARALVENDENLRTVLRKVGLMTRDPREKERKKPGLKRARKAPQFSKR